MQSSRGQAYHEGMKAEPQRTLVASGSVRSSVTSNDALARTPPRYGIELADRPSTSRIPELEAEAGALAERGSSSPRNVVNGPRPIQALLGEGTGLASPERHRHEAWLGASLDRVRIHEGPAADALARTRGVEAFACGPDIVVSRPWAPSSSRGRQVLAHELAHTTQQARGANGQPAVLGFEGPEHRRLGDELLVELGDWLKTKAGHEWAKNHGFDADRIHQQIAADPFAGGKRKIQVSKDLALSPGEVIALAGDHFAGPASIQAGKPAQIHGILDVMHAQERQTISNDEASKQFELISEGRYTDLAKNNTPHFAPENQALWAKLHAQAIATARAGALERAYLIDAAAGHYLTDAFSAGHLLDAKRIEIHVKMYHMLHPPRVPAQPYGQSLMSILDMALSDPLLVKLALKNIHDQLNLDGFEIHNAAGMKWKTCGDDRLDKSPETKRIAALAVFLSRNQITRAAADKSGPPPDPREVTNLLPNADTIERATQYGISLIEKAARGAELLSVIQSNLGLLPVKVDVGLRNVPAPFALPIRAAARWGVNDLLQPAAMPPGGGPERPSGLGPSPGFMQVPPTGIGPPQPKEWRFNATLFRFDANFGGWTSPYGDLLKKPQP